MCKSCIENKDSIDLEAVEQALLTLNYRLTSRALDLWQGNEPGFSLPALYDGLGDMLNPATISKVSRDVETMKSERIFHGLLGHYLQYRVFPLKTSPHRKRGKRPLQISETLCAGLLGVPAPVT
ncbi:MAG: hypothetical protein ACNY01_13740 [Desulfobacteria bacterium]